MELENERGFMNSNIADTINRNSYTAKYDASVKEMLADKQILARILKYSLEEFANEELSDIIDSMNEPDVSNVRMEPGFTNSEQVMRTVEEDSVIGEGAIYYDIRFSVYHGAELIKMLINIEAQKSTNPTKLGYYIDNRIIFYLGRMVSSQKGVEFQNSNYDDLKAVRSIWICMDSADDEDSINRIRFTQENVYGKQIELDNIDKVQGVIIRLRKNENVKTSKNVLIAMLEELLKKDDAENKKKRLEEDYGIAMNVETERKVNSMCNLSEVVLEQGMERGMAQGIELVAENMLKANKPIEEIEQMTGITQDKQVEMKKKLEG